MRLTRGQAWLLVGAAAWTWYVWATRIWNIVGDPTHSTAFKAVHGVLAVVSVALLTPVGLIGIRSLRASRHGSPDPSPAGSPGSQDPSRHAPARNP